jgi:hypothetical protein
MKYQFLHDRIVIDVPEEEYRIFVGVMEEAPLLDPVCLEVALEDIETLKSKLLTAHLLGSGLHLSVSGEELSHLNRIFDTSRNTSKIYRGHPTVRIMDDQFLEAVIEWGAISKPPVGTVS